MTSRLEGFFAASLALSSCVDSGQQTFTPEDAMHTRGDIGEVFEELNYRHNAFLKNFKSPEITKELVSLKNLSKTINKLLEFLKLAAMVSSVREESELAKKSNELFELTEELLNRVKVLQKKHEILLNPEDSQELSKLIIFAQKIREIVKITQETKIYPEDLELNKD